MVDYRRMGSLEQHMANATSSVILHGLDMWKNPRWTVTRIQALIVVAILMGFFLAACGSCRRWSNHWILQKGFTAAYALSLSLGTYTVGVMQSSTVKSEMYPIWTVSLFTVFSCIDPVTSYNGLDYKGPLSKMVFGIFLHCGYVLVISFSINISSSVVNTSIGVLCAITLFRSMHRSLSLMVQSSYRNMVEALETRYGEKYLFLGRGANIKGASMTVDFGTGFQDPVTMGDIDEILRLGYETDKVWRSCYDECVAFCLSHNLQRHFFGLTDYHRPSPDTLESNCIDFKWLLKVIDVELAFLYEVFFTGNPAHHYYMAKSTSLWALASLSGICFVGVAIAISETMTDPGGSTSTIVVDTTTADFVITFVILVSLALLQLVLLIRCWTSNWARVAIACAYVRKVKPRILMSSYDKPAYRWSWWMRLKIFVATRNNWFDNYLWQDKIGQYSVLPEGILTEIREGKRRQCRWMPARIARSCRRVMYTVYFLLRKICFMLGLFAIQILLDRGPRATTVRLDDDVKACIVDFLGQIKTNNVDENWLSFRKNHPAIKQFLPYSNDYVLKSSSPGYRYTSSVMVWHTATWVCQLAEQKREKEKQSGASYLKRAAATLAGCFREATGEVNTYRRVANALSKYCAYLVVSAPELLPGPGMDTNSVRRYFERVIRTVLNKKPLWALSDLEDWTESFIDWGDYLIEFKHGLYLAEWLRSDDDGPWVTLASVWVRMLLYAAPYGSVEAHRQRLPQGGEFITHLYTLLYHLDIREWNLPENLHQVLTTDDAKVILTGADGSIVVAFLEPSADQHNELATASRLEDSVTFYYTTDPNVAKLFDIDPASGRPALVFLNNKAKKKTFYDGEFHTRPIALFVSGNIFALAKEQKQETNKQAQGTNKKQGSEDGGQNEGGIEEENPPPLS